MGSTPGTLVTNSIKIPAKSGPAEQDRFNGKSFEDIKGILDSVGISIKFKKYQSNGTWSNWIDLSAIDTYSPSDPKIQIGFQFNNKQNNLQLLNGTTEITNQQTYDLRLNLPKLITISQTVINQFKTDHGISGNTKNLNYDQAKINKLIEAIRKDSANANIEGIENAPLQVFLA